MKIKFKTGNIVYCKSNDVTTLYAIVTNPVGYKSGKFEGTLLKVTGETHRYTIGWHNDEWNNDLWELYPALLVIDSDDNI